MAGSACNSLELQSNYILLVLFVVLLGVIELVSVVFWNEVSVGMILQFVIELVSVVRGTP